LILKSEDTLSTFFGHIYDHHLMIYSFHVVEMLK